MAREFKRSSRVSSQMQKELAIILQQGIKDPRIGFITVNEVELSKDLATAKVYITALGADAEGQKNNIAWLNDAAPYIRSEMGKRMRLRNVPYIKFYYDNSFEKGMRVSELLAEPMRSTDEPEGDD
ncbi:ribosome-binding factor A [Bathymodiolus platifrons methanotrophic gill symbiont]|uniref:30S ribosome-binding factor RbfA n=1 Tax=Bathymodiolus platifrons methanotrophic gill symbiont TaxID=113268 RepID=UPI000B41E6E9|nr:30S ribosome-binding factor RbfA [Bathymodiolus platifrons methanotrophic gill symbiont]TXK95578.1 ribosome-binding factor A [Methylococcaceae bacterium HT1]TXL13178.1 ribosome-binding factor A [Methylococcaceae bacterium HT4]TXL17097.1 ribosome-binding factor A [Methylococcaceae bacterium HT3]TXL19219.1 ribosome-binding factor A [Methylococcaceae bacterium HT5]TXL22074.1 ribosome-binding factor A [Methylococcaceae bacterium HT2]